MKCIADVIQDLSKTHLDLVRNVLTTYAHHKVDSESIDVWFHSANQIKSLTEIADARRVVREQ